MTAIDGLMQGQREKAVPEVPHQGSGILSKRQIEELFRGGNLFDSGAELVQVLW